MRQKNLELKEERNRLEKEVFNTTNTKDSSELSSPLQKYKSNIFFF